MEGNELGGKGDEDNIKLNLTPPLHKYISTAKFNGVMQW